MNGVAGVGCWAARPKEHSAASVSPLIVTFIRRPLLWGRGIIAFWWYIGLYVAAAARVPLSRVPRKPRSAPHSDSFGVPRAAPAFQGAEDPGYRRVLRIGARRQPRARGAGAADAARTRRERRRRAVHQGAEQDPPRPRMGALLRGRARAGPAAHGVDPEPAIRESPLCRHVRRRPRHHGGG